MLNFANLLSGAPSTSVDVRSLTQCLRTSFLLAWVSASVSPVKAAALAGLVNPMRLQWAGLRTALVRSLNFGLTGCASASAG